MNKNNCFFYLFTALAMLFAACSESDSPNQEEAPAYDDLFGGKLFVFLNLSDLDSGEFPLETSEPIDLYPYNTDGVKLTLNNQDGDQTVSVGIPNGYEGETQIIPAYAVGRETGQDRNVIFIVSDGRGQTAADNGEKDLKPKFGQFIGKGTDCTRELGNVKKSPVFLFDSIPQNELYISRNGISKTTTHTLKEHSFKSLMKKWGLNLGISGKAAGVSGGCNFGISEKTKSSNEREYLMVSHNIEVTEVMLNTVHLESMISKHNLQIDSVCKFLNLLNKDFLADLQYTPDSVFTYEKFIKDWGTDVITQATLGGTYNMIYSREENIYEHEIDVDFSVYAKYGKKSEEKESGDILKFLDKLLHPEEPDITGKLSVNYMNRQYFEATKTECDYYSTGGFPNITDPERWAEAFSKDENFNYWVPTSYYIRSDNKDDEKFWPLYTIDKVAQMAVNAAELILDNVPNKSKFDQQAIAQARKNAGAIAEARKKYITQQELKDVENSPIVLCDIMMVNNPKRRKNGEPEPIVKPDPKNPEKFRTYYPMITNRNFDIGKPSNDKMRGYPIDTNDGVFVAASHVSSHYWYYAMAHASDCYGIEDIQFLTLDEQYKGEKEDKLKYAGYEHRGDHASQGLSGLLVKKRYVYVKFGDGKNKKNLITAFGIYDDQDDYKNLANQPAVRIIASTVGAEIPKNANSDEIQEFYDFWNKEPEYITKGEKRFYQGGGGVFPHHFYPICSKKPLKTNKFYELKFNTTKWGDKK